MTTIAVGVAGSTIPLTEEEQWDLQMKELEEVDRLTKLAEENMPSELRPTLLILIKKFPGLQRMPSFQLMDAYDWKFEELSDLSNILHRIPLDKVLKTIDFLLSLIPIENNRWKLHYLCLQIFIHLQSLNIVEWCTEVDRSDGMALIVMARHLSSVQRELMIYTIHEVNLSEMIHMIQNIKEHPERKNCDLCRQKRLFDLEYRMRTNQFPTENKHLLPTPGMIPYYDRNMNYWGADDEKLFSFDLETEQIYWNHRYPVNLVDICDTCLTNAHQAITNQGRFNAIYHIPVTERKESYKQQREIEQGLAAMVMIVAKERKFRRLREFVIEALKVQKIGLLKEKEQEDNLRIQQQQRDQILAEKRRREELNQKAKAVEEKWFEQEEMTRLQSLEKRRTYTLLKYHQGFDGEVNPAPILRKRKTWRLEDFDQAGLPLTPTGANKLFGISHDMEEDDAPKIDYWKFISQEMIKTRKQKENQKKQALRAKELEELQTLRNYVNERMITMERYHLQKQHISEEYEKNRLFEREIARETRRQERFLQYLQYERDCMMEEDYRSYQIREYEYEQQREQIEREGMFNEECEQTELDRFWGLEYYSKRMKSEEYRLQDLYIQQIEEKNLQLYYMQCTKKIPKQYFTNYLPKIAKSSKLLKPEMKKIPPMPSAPSVPSATASSSVVASSPSLQGMSGIEPEESSRQSFSKIPTLPAIVSPEAPATKNNAPPPSSKNANNSNNANTNTNTSYQIQVPITSPSASSASQMLTKKNLSFISIDSTTSSFQNIILDDHEGGGGTHSAAMMNNNNNHTTTATTTTTTSTSNNNNKKKTEPLKEIYDYQHQLHEYEKQKHFQYIKHLKAEEIRMNTKAKLRPKLYPW